MEYISSNKFIPKLETEKFKIGSFDVFLDKSKELMDKNLNTKDECILISELPTAYRASIVKSEDDSYVGYISAYDIVFEDDMASIILQTSIKLSKEDIEEILTSYKEFLYNDLYIKNIKKLYITNFDEVIVEQNEFKINYASLNSEFFNPRC